MITEWKRCMKLVKYGYNLKSSIVCAMIFFVLGMIICVMDQGNMFIMGGLYIVLGPLMLAQIIYTGLASGMALSSPRRRFMEIQLQDGMQLLVGVLGYLLVVLLAIAKVYLGHSESGIYVSFGRDAYGQMILNTGILTGILLVYMGIVYKYFLISILLFAGGFAFVYIGMWGGVTEITSSVNMVSGTLLGLLFVLIGEVLSAVLRRLLYKKPLNKYAMGAALRKQM